MTETVASLTLAPVSRTCGHMRLPGSKSISNRALLLAALARGRTRLEGLLDSDDTRVMRAALEHCGLALETLGPETLQVEGACPFPVLEGVLFMGNAGTAIRTLTAVFALMGASVTLSGIDRMHERPIGDLVDALRSLGAVIDYLGTPGYPPLRLAPGRLRADAPVRVRGDVSSQFLTGLLIAAPLMPEGLEIEVEGTLISRPYVEITLALMARFGVVVERGPGARFRIPPGAAYVAPGSFLIEGDASSASYFMAAATLGGGPLRIQGAGRDSIQGDMGFAEVVQAMGAQLEWEADALTVSGPRVAEGARLAAFDRDFNLIPDAAMTAAVMALFADGPCTLRNIASWRVKETDRIAAMHAELEKLGAQVASGPDWLRVHPLARDQWRTAQIATYDDHRMAMCFSLAAFGPVPQVILDPGCVSKTFPDYFKVFAGVVA
ncbi:MAG: 3-phosphoshikimate 1-carboxyvinyltransferase [Castellaniella sp.]